MPNWRARSKWLRHESGTADPGAIPLHQRVPDGARNRPVRRLPAYHRRDRRLGLRRRRLQARRLGRDPAPRSAAVRVMLLPASMRVFERGWLSANNILFIGRDGTTLVDSGYVTHAPQTLALVRHALGDRPLDRIVNTHLHSDHCGGNALLKDAFGSRIAIPVSEAGKVRRWDEEA